MSKKSETTEVATRPESLPPSMMEDMVQFAGAGVSERQEDQASPFLMIAQSNSPAVKKQQEDRYIPGLEPGDLYNSSTREYWAGSEGLLVVPAWFQKSMVEWKPNRGGWVAAHDIETPLKKEARWVEDQSGRRILTLPSGNILVDTSYYFVFTAKGAEGMVVSMSSTGLAASRQWQTLMKRTKVPNGGGGLVVAPSFARAYRLKTVWRQNDAGDWFNWSVLDDRWAPDNYQAAYDAAKQFYLRARDGSGVMVGRPPSDDVSSVADGADEPPI